MAARGRRERRRRPGQAGRRPTRRCCRPASCTRSGSTRASCRRARRSGSPTTSSRRTATRTCARTGIDKPVTLYTVPTSAGVATRGVRRPERRLRVDRQHAEAQRRHGVPGRAEQGVRGRRSSKALGRLDKKVQSPAARRSRARRRRRRRRRRRSELAVRLQAAPRRRSSKLEVSPGRRAANQQLASALKQTGDAYGKLASAASSGNKSAYKKASRRCRRGAGGRRRAAATPGRGLQDRRAGERLHPNGAFPNRERALHIAKTSASEKVEPRTWNPAQSPSD